MEPRASNILQKGHLFTGGMHFTLPPRSVLTKRMPAWAGAIPWSASASGAASRDPRRLAIESVQTNQRVWDRADQSGRRGYLFSDKTDVAFFDRDPRAA